MGEPQRRDEVFAQARVVRLPAQYLDEPAEHAVAGVVVRELLAGREQLRHLVQGRDVLLETVVTHPGVGENVPFEPGGVVEQSPDGDLLGRLVVGDAELRQIGAHRPVEVDLALVEFVVVDDLSAADWLCPTRTPHPGAADSTPGSVVREHGWGSGIGGRPTGFGYVQRWVTSRRCQADKVPGVTIRWSRSRVGGSRASATSSARSAQSGLGRVT